MLLDSAAPRSPGPSRDRAASGSPAGSGRRRRDRASGPWRAVRGPRSAGWCPYLPAATSAGLKPSLKVLGAPHSLETSVFWRGWYQKSYMNSMAVLLALPAASTEKSRASSTANPPGSVAVGVAKHRDRDDVTRHAVHGVRRTQPRLLLDLLAVDHLLDGAASADRRRRAGGCGRSGIRGRSACRAAAVSGMPTSMRSSRSGAARRRRWACPCAPRSGRRRARRDRRRPRR